MSTFAPAPGIQFLIGLLWIVMAVGVGSAAGPPPSTLIESSPLNSPSSPDQHSTRFRAYAIDGFTHKIVDDHPLSYLYQTGAACGGVAIGDVDGDGLPDLFLVNGPGDNRLYRQTAPLKFTDVTRSAAILDSHQAWGVGATMADLDSDGDLDIYVCNYDAPNLYYENDGNGRFKEVANEFGLDVVDACYMAAPCDYDRDGDLDLYLLTNRYYHPGNPEGESVWRYVDGEPKLLQDAEKYFSIDRSDPSNPVAIELGRRDYLFRNDGERERHFSNITDVAGIMGRGDGLSATWWDYNEDGWVDLYVGNDFSEPDRLYRNEGDGTLTNVAADTIPHCPWFAMGADVGDLNDDGHLDFLIADMSATNHFKQKINMGDMGAGRRLIQQHQPVQLMRNALYVSTGTERFMEAAHLAGLSSSDWTWTVKIVDLDNDGRNDVFFTNGMARNFTDSDIRPPKKIVGAARWSFYKDQPPRKESNLAFRGVGPLQFEETSAAWGLNHLGMSYSSAHGDLDRDGDLDLVVANLEEGVTVYENVTTDQHAVLFRLMPRGGNRSAIGATVRIVAGGKSQTRQLQPVAGYLSSNDELVHFGLGKDRTIQQVQIRWPSGHWQTITDLKADMLHSIREPVKQSRRIAAHPESPLLVPYDFGSRAIHREVEFDDFSQQPLLPNKLSQLGPAMAWGDVDRDGDSDLFLGQGAGWMSMLYLRSGDGRLLPQPQLAFARDEEREDMGAVFFDVDGDDDLDLYVASGGNEFEPNSPQLRDRLYLNDGHGQFVQAPRESHPELGGSNGAVAAADFDRDGDVDLFVGGRMVPGAYPTAPPSVLLRNDSGQLVDVTNEIAAEISSAGMVTSALWTDADGDEWTDLITTHDWGSIRYWRNTGGQFVDNSDAAGLATRTGWWNGVAAGDVDHDGDIDYVTTNWGGNTKYHATSDQPVELYYGEFGGGGQSCLIEAEYERGTLFPVRGLSCTSNAMPFVSKKFASFREFAAATLADIYTPHELARSRRFEANTLTTGIWINEGADQGASGEHSPVRFRFVPLPMLAQASPAFGVVVTDINADGHLDICIAQNFFHPQWETGPMDGGLGCVLLGRGDGAFEPQSPSQSGFVVPADARSMAVADMNHDQKPDLMVAVNNGDMVALVNQSTARFLTVKLRGQRGNRGGLGARVTTTSQSGVETTCEIVAGGGYLCQSPAEVSFGNPSRDPVELITVAWPDGAVSRVRLVNDQSTCRVSHPAAMEAPQLTASFHAVANRDPAGFAESQVDAGIHWAADGQRSRAAFAFRRAFLSDPSNLRAMTRLGDTYTDLGQFREAEWYHRQCLLLEPEFFEAHRGLGRVAYSKGLFELAESHYLRALTLAPDDVPTTLNLANISVARNRFDEAIYTFKRLLSQHPQMAHAWYGLGIALHRQDRIGQAAAALSRAARSDPRFIQDESVAEKCAEIHCEYGQLMAQRGEHDAALMQFERAARILPRFAAAYAETGHVWLAKGAHEKAVKAYRMACVRHSNDWTAWNNLAWLLATQETISNESAHDAEGAARHAVRLQPNLPDTYDTLGVCLAANGKFDEANQIAQRAEQLTLQLNPPGDVQAIRARRELYQRQERYIEIRP